MKKIYSILILLILINYVKSQTISTSALLISNYCQNETINIDFTITGIFNPGNIFTAQLSDESGNFASATDIGTLNSINSGTISASLPNLLLSGTQYRIRVIADNPAVIGTDNGTDLTIQGDTNNPNTFGNNIWNAYCYNIASYTNNPAAFDLSDYKGMYTQAGESFNSSDLWPAGSNPSTAAGYSGCSINNDRHIVQYKRKGFPCNYYTLSIAGPGNISGHDDAAKLIIDGVVVWSNTGCCAARPNVWAGFLGPNSEVEFTWSDNGGQSYGRMTFDIENYPTVSPDVTICAGSTTTLTATGGANYDWSMNPTHLVAPLNLDSVVVSPIGGTPNSVETYTVSTYDTATTCTASNTINVTINSLPSTSVTPSTATYCGAGNLDVTASGANTYTWHPATGVTITSPSGNTATLSPASTTTYTVVGSNNCANDSDFVTINIDVPAGNPNNFGNYSWDVYCYNGNNFNTYFGMYTHNSLDFDTRNLWGNNNSPSDAPGYLGCTIPNNDHSYSYKRKGFDCGYYQLDIPNHDDRVNLIIDGVSVFSQNTWFNNTYKTDVWQGYLDADSEIEYTIREFTGGSNGGLIFIYLHGPNNSNKETVWNGKTSNDWSDASNWCNGIPNDTVSAYIPYNTSHNPLINSAGASTKALYLQENATLTISGTNNLDVYGSLTISGTLTPNNSTIKLLGSDTISLSSTNTYLSFRNLEINNSGAIICSSLNNNKIIITKNLNFINGQLFTGITNSIEFTDNATATGMSNNSFINGNVSKIGNDVFTFPIGKNGIYRPIAISAPSNITDGFSAEYFETDPNGTYDETLKDPSIHHLSNCEYWLLNVTNGTPSVNVTLSWDTNSCGVTNLSELLVARWDNSMWKDHGNGGTTGGTTTGTVITSAPVSSFSPFTIASTTNANPLPIKLLSFNAKLIKGNVWIDWKTETEINNDYFTIERSSDLNSWESIKEIRGAGNSNTILSYASVDQTPLNGVSFYRLKQTDFNGGYSYSDIQTITLNTGADITIYPNPVRDNLTISNLCKECVVNIYTSSGQLIYSGNEQKINTNDWIKGLYNIVITEDNGTIHSQRIVK